MMKQEDCYVILVNYCNPQITIECIESLKRARCNPKKIVVVDNNSPDDSRKVLRRIQDIVLIESEENGGFAAANNIGIKYALSHKGKSVLLLNNDTIVSENFFEKLFYNADCKTVYVPKIYYYSKPNMLWYAGGKINYKKGLQRHFGDMKFDCDKFSYEKDVDYATGCCMLISKEIIEKIGLLAEEYFMYWEDMDYSLKLKKNAIQIRYLPEVKMWHKIGLSGGKSSKMAIYYCNRNRFLVLKKYHFGLCAWSYTIITRALKYGFSFVDKSNNRMILKAWLDFRKGSLGKVDL